MGERKRMSMLFCPMVKLFGLLFLSSSAYGGCCTTAASSCLTEDPCLPICTKCPTTPSTSITTSKMGNRLLFADALPKIQQPQQPAGGQFIERLVEVLSDLTDSFQPVIQQAQGNPHVFQGPPAQPAPQQQQQIMDPNAFQQAAPVPPVAVQPQQVMSAPAFQAPPQVTPAPPQISQQPAVPNPPMFQAVNQMQQQQMMNPHGFQTSPQLGAQNQAMNQNGFQPALQHAQVQQPQMMNRNGFQPAPQFSGNLGANPFVNRFHQPSPHHFALQNKFPQGGQPPAFQGGAQFPAQTGGQHPAQFGAPLQFPLHQMSNYVQNFRQRFPGGRRVVNRMMLRPAPRPYWRPNIQGYREPGHPGSNEKHAGYHSGVLGGMRRRELRHA